MEEVVDTLEQLQVSDTMTEEACQFVLLEMKDIDPTFKTHLLADVYPTATGDVYPMSVDEYQGYCSYRIEVYTAKEWIALMTIHVVGEEMKKLQPHLAAEFERIRVQTVGELYKKYKDYELHPFFHYGWPQAGETCDV